MNKLENKSPCELIHFKLFICCRLIKKCCWVLDIFIQHPYPVLMDTYKKIQYNKLQTIEALGVSQARSKSVSPEFAPGSSTSLLIGIHGWLPYPETWHTQRDPSRWYHGQAKCAPSTGYSLSNQRYLLHSPKLAFP